MRIAELLVSVFDFGVDGSQLCLCSGVCDFIHAPGQLVDLGQLVLKIKCERFKYSSDGPSCFALLVPVHSMNHELDELGIEFRNSLLHLKGGIENQL